MYPYLLREPFEISSYFTLEMLAFIVGIILAVKEAKRQGVDPVKIIDLTLFIFIGGMFGGKMFHVFFDGHLMDYVNMCFDPFEAKINAKYLVKNCINDAQCVSANLGNICNLADGKCYVKSCTAAFEIWRGGFVYYGGLITSILVVIIFTKVKKLSLAKITDLLAPSLAIGLAIGRLGCFFAGCCYGRVSDVFFAVSFPAGSPAHMDHLKHIDNGINHSLPVIPTQLFSVFANIFIFIYLYFYLRKRKKYDGQMALHLLFFYSTFRFIIEFFRGDQRGSLLVFSTSQWISIILIIMLSIITFFMKKRFRNLKK